MTENQKNSLAFKAASKADEIAHAKWQEHTAKMDAIGAYFRAQKVYYTNRIVTPIDRVATP